MSKVLGPCKSSSVTEASDTCCIDSETPLEIVNSVRGMLNSGMTLNCTVNVNVNSEKKVIRLCSSSVFICL